MKCRPVVVHKQSHIARHLPAGEISRSSIRLDGYYIVRSDIDRRHAGVGVEIAEVFERLGQCIAPRDTCKSRLIIWANLMQPHDIFLVRAL